MAPLNTKGDINRCHPVARGAFSHLTSRLAKGFDLQETKTWWRPFETYRSPVEQQRLYDSRNETGRMVTKARAWQSAHQYGLAVDYVALMLPLNAESTNAERQWSWDSSYDWDYIARVVRDEYAGALVCDISWDPGHVEHVMFEDYRTIWQGYDPVDGLWKGDSV